MHRKIQLNELVKKWLELGLKETCSRESSLSRVVIRKQTNPEELHFTNGRGRKSLVIGISNNEISFTTGYDEKDEHSVISVAIWALETALENY